MFNEYSINYEERKQGILSCQNCKFFTLLKNYVDNIINNIPTSCRNCPNYLLCCSVADHIIHNKSPSITFNSSVRYEPNAIELIVYNQNHKIIVKDEQLNNIKKIDTSPLVRKNYNNKFEVCKDSFTYSNFYRSMNNSRKRTLQQFYNYCIANDWEYFITLTFADDKVDRYDDLLVKSKWSIFQHEVKRKNPNAKIIVVPEYHAKVNLEGKKALHFHGFLSNVPNLTFIPAVNPLTNEPIFSKYVVDGKKIPRLNIKDWKYGYSTADIIIEKNNLRVTNYIQKYMFKGDSLGYGEKKFYHTKNLDMCYVQNLNIYDDDINDVVNNYNLEVVKQTDNFTVYRTKRGDN